MGGLEQGKDAAHVQLKQYLTTVFRGALTYWSGSEIGLKALVNEVGQHWLKQNQVIERRAGSTLMEFTSSFREHLVEKMVEQVLSKPVELKKNDDAALSSIAAAAKEIMHLLNRQTIEYSAITRVSFTFMLEGDCLYLVPGIVEFEHEDSRDVWSPEEIEDYKVKIG